MKFFTQIPEPLPMEIHENRSKKQCFAHNLKTIRPIFKNLVSLDRSWSGASYGV